MQRDQMIDRLDGRSEPWDMLVIGGGATGAGIAVDAASRGYAVLLVEQHDFGKGTSSRSTKLAHGGVRYLEQGNVSLVMEALKERGLMRRNAPHLVREVPFIVPNYVWWEAPFYGFGLKIYSMLAGKYGFGPCQRLSRDETLRRLPTIRTEGLRGGVVYYDGQFDDARMLISLIATAAEQGATVINYMHCAALKREDDGFISGAVLHDNESGREYEVRAKAVINATGAYADGVRRLAADRDEEFQPIIAPSQGIHLVFDRSFLPGDSAIMVPHTRDGRVMFAIPWHGHALVGTTDTALKVAPLEPVPMAEEIEFILTTAGQYLEKSPTESDVLSMFAGIRPLVKSGDGNNTAALSRDHTIHIDHSGLITIAGGKWTTYRNMAQDCVDQAATLGRLDEKECVTKRLNIHGFHSHASKFGPLEVYGSDAPEILRLAKNDPALAQQLHADLPYIQAQVLWAVREEMARSVEDVLSRRLRALPLNARAAWSMAEPVAECLAEELGRSPAWKDDQLAAFRRLCEASLPCALIA